MGAETDNNERFAQYMVKGSMFVVPKQYTRIQPFCQDVDGVMCTAEVPNQGANEAVAIKKFPNAFDNLSSAKGLLRELKVLRQLRHENVVDVRLVYLGCEANAYDDIYVVSESMDMDLASILRRPERLSAEHCEFFLYQILRGLQFVHSADVVHRNLKPKSLFVSANCDLKICNFGFARLSYPDEVFHMRHTIKYRGNCWYRSPEVLLTGTQIGKPADIWSVGCIFAHMLRGRPIFRGRDSQHQLQLIMNCLGGPEADIFQKIPDITCEEVMPALTSSTPKSLADRVIPAPTLAVGALGEALCFNPGQRITVGQFLQHPYLATFHCPEDEPERESLDVTEFDFQREEVDIAAIREEMRVECLHYTCT